MEKQNFIIDCLHWMQMQCQLCTKMARKIKKLSEFCLPVSWQVNALLETLAVAHRPQGFTEHSLNAVEKLKAYQLMTLCSSYKKAMFIL